MGIFDFLHKSKAQPVDPSGQTPAAPAPNTSAPQAPQQPINPVDSSTPTAAPGGVDPGSQPPTPTA